MAFEREWLTRKRRIDPRLDARGWRARAGNSTPVRGPYRTEEEETDNGPADYVLWLDHHPTAVVEAKKLAVGPQEVLTQAERYARGLRNSSYNFDGLKAPLLYSTNGEVIWFRDARHLLNRSRRVADFHTPEALSEFLTRDFDSPARWPRWRRAGTVALTDDRSGSAGGMRRLDSIGIAMVSVGPIHTRFRHNDLSARSYTGAAPRQSSTGPAR